MHSKAIVAFNDHLQCYDVLQVYRTFLYLIGGNNRNFINSLGIAPNSRSGSFINF